MVFLWGMPEWLKLMTFDHKPDISDVGLSPDTPKSIKVSRHLSMAGDFRSL